MFTEIYMHDFLKKMIIMKKKSSLIKYHINGCINSSLYRLVIINLKIGVSYVMYLKVQLLDQLCFYFILMIYASYHKL